MSAGAFVNSFYDAFYAANVHPIRIQPETASASVGSTTNAAPSGPADNPISAQVSRSTRALGLHARIVFAKIAGTPPTGYSTVSKIRIPALNASFFAACTKGATLTYLGTTWTVTGRREEKTV